jgi:hypothetical protein
VHLSKAVLSLEDPGDQAGSERWHNKYDGVCSVVVYKARKCIVNDVRTIRSCISLHARLQE